MTHFLHDLATATEEASRQQQQQAQAQEQQQQKQRQKQRQQPLAAVHEDVSPLEKLLGFYIVVALHAMEIMELWHVLLITTTRALRELLQPTSAFAASISAAIAFTAAAVPLLSVGLKGMYPGSAGSDNCSDLLTMARQYVQPGLCQILQSMLVTAASGQGVGDLITVMITSQLAEIDNSVVPELQHQERLLLADKLPELLLLLLAYRAAELQTPSEERPCTASATLSEQLALADADDEQQARLLKVVRVGDSSTVMAVFTALGVSPHITSGLELAAASAVDRPFGDALYLLSRSISERRMADGSTGVACGSGECDQSGQQQPCNKSALLFPDRVMLPAVKLLLSMALQVPAEKVPTMGMYVDVAMQLLVSMVSMDAKPTADLQLGSEAAACQQAGKNQSSRQPVLSAAVAARLLHPIVQMLPKAVLRTLKAAAAEKQQTDSHRRCWYGSETVNIADVSVVDSLVWLPGNSKRWAPWRYEELLMWLCRSGVLSVAMHPSS